MSSFTTPLRYTPTGTSRRFRTEYRIDEPFTYVVGSLSNGPRWEISVPAGFVTDFVSVPYPLNKLFRPDGNFSKAAVVHDYLYKTAAFDVTQFVADAIFYEAMRVSNANRITSFIIWSGVRLFGRSFYKQRVTQ